MIRCLFVTVVLSCTAVVASTGCQVLPAPHHSGDYEVVETNAVDDDDGQMAIDGLRVSRRSTDRDGEFGEAYPSFAVDLNVGPQTGELPAQIGPDDVELVVSHPDNSEYVAKDDRAIRGADKLKIKRDGRWKKVDKVSLESAQSMTLQVHFEDVTPFAKIEGRESTHYRPADIKIAISTADEVVATADLVRGSDYGIQWVRDSADYRLFMAVTGGAIAFEPGHVATVFGVSLGVQQHRVRDWYLRSSTDIEFGTALRVPEHVEGIVGTGQLYLQTGVALSGGYVFSFPAVDARLGAGWTPTLVARGGTDELAVPHWGILEFSYAPRAPRSNPYRAEDFAPDFGLYARLMAQLGNFGPRDEPSAFMLSFGFSYQPTL